MIKQSFLPFALLIVLAVFTSCNKEGNIDVEGSAEAVTDVAELAYTQHIATDIEETADEATIAPPPPGQESLRDCAEITAEQEKGVFPNAITIDFGDGCPGKDGKVRSGKLIITLSDTLHNEGATRTVTFENYFVDDVQISGSKTWENQGISDEGLITIHKTADLTMNFPDGASSSWNTDRTITKNTQFVKYRKAGKWKKRIIRFKGTVSVMGSTSGVNKEGISFSAVILEELVKDENCFWFGSGMIEFTKDDEVRTLDYGDGSCDRLATATLPDGSTKEIKIRPFWSR